METNTQNTMNRNRPYTGQMHTHLGDRGKALVSGLTIRDLADCFIRGFLLATPDEALLKHSKLTPQQLREQLELGENACIDHNQVYVVDASYLDPIAVVQNMLCEVEKMMGTFPNIPLPNAPEAQPSMDARMEADINQLGLNAPRVPKEHIDMLMEHVQYKTHIVEGTTTTVAVAVLPMGTVDFTLAIESTACVDKSNFNAALGAKYAIEKAAESARNKLWELEGYVLALCIHNIDMALAQSLEPFDPNNTINS